MQSLFATGGARSSILTSAGCGIATPVLCGAINGLTSTSISQTGAVINWTAVSGATGYVLQYRPATSTAWITVNPTSNTTTLSGLTAGTSYNVQVQSVCAAGSSAFSSITFTTLSTTTTCTDNYESNNTSSTAITIAANTNITARIGSSTDVDWFKFSNTSTARNIRINLTNLPLDYDLYLYNPSGTLIGQSINGSNTSEAITFNTTTVGTYRVRVIGYGGAFSSTSCYTLRASISASSFRDAEETPAAELSSASPDASVLVASVFPNPTNGKLNVVVEAAEAQQALLRICDVAGREVFQQNTVCNAGSNTFIVDMEALPNGYYLLVIDNGQLSSTARIVKN
jgi:hypothetical protein